jgi:prevent-host-death family protein
MKQIALAAAETRLSALVEEVERTGKDIVITRQGRPAVRLSPVPQEEDAAKRAAALERLRILREQISREHPDAPWPSWEVLKGWAHDEDNQLK